MLDWMKNIFGKKASVQQSSRFIAETELTYVRSEHLSLGMYIANRARIAGGAKSLSSRVCRSYSAE